MLALKFVCLALVAYAYANPLPEEEIQNLERRVENMERQFEGVERAALLVGDTDEELTDAVERTARQDYPYISYGDYYPSPYYYYNDYYPAPSAYPAYYPQPSYAPQQPSYAPVEEAPRPKPEIKRKQHVRRPQSNNQLETSYSLDYKKNHRRQFRPLQSTTQKYTVWDLAK